MTESPFVLDRDAYERFEAALENPSEEGRANLQAFMDEPSRFADPDVPGHAESLERLRDLLARPRRFVSQ